MVVICLGRSENGVRWMGNVLGDALWTVKERYNDGGGVNQKGVARTRRKNETDLSSGRGSFAGGLRDMCRALFHHCLLAIGFVPLITPRDEDALEGQGVSGGAVTLIAGVWGKRVCGGGGLFMSCMTVVV